MVCCSRFYNAPILEEPPPIQYRYMVIAYWPGEDIGDYLDDFPTIIEAQEYIKGYKAGWPGITFNISRQPEIF